MKPPKNSLKRVTEGSAKKAPAGPSGLPQPIDLVPAFVHLRRILVPLDFSEFSYQALSFAMPFAEQFGAELVLIHVFEPRGYPLDSVIVPREMQDANVQMKRQAQQHLENARQQLLAGKNFPSRSMVRSGTPYQEICAAARELESELIIMGTHGHTGLKHLYLGSTAERVVRHAPCPVLVVRKSNDRTKGKRKNN
jgi:universal stress protein A